LAVFVAVMSIAVILTVLWDAFEAVVLPRRVTRRFRLTRLFYRSTWRPWSALARQIASAKRRETYLSFFGPMSLLMLLSVWALGLIVGFGTLQWSLGSPLNVSGGRVGFGTYVYLSGTTFFTLGLGDVTPLAPSGRTLAIIESGLGFGFLALIIGYLPVIYQGFSRRELNISLLDARAGSPPSAAELLRRHGQNMEELDRLLQDWERWSADLMESHLSYPVLCYYRSQHDNQSWLAALTTILDASAMVIAGIDGPLARQARLTFAMARHAVADLAQIFNTPPRAPVPDRLLSAQLTRLRANLAAAGINLSDGADADDKLSTLRQMYEPYVNALAEYLFVTLPAWMPAAETFDNWQTSAWGRIPTGNSATSLSGSKDNEHF
jgi:hypothetical protein